MKLHRVFIVLFFLVNSCYCGFITSSLQEARAIKAYKNKKYDEALKIYNQLVANNPYDAVYNYNIGEVLYKSGKYKESIPYYHRAAEHGSAHIQVQSLFNIGNVHMQEKSYDQAIISYEGALKLDPENKFAKHNLEVAKKLQEQKDQEDPKRDQEQKQDSQDQKNDQDEKQDKDSEQKDQKQNENSDKDSKSDEKDSGDQKESGSEKDEKKKGSSEKEQKKGAGQNKGQENQQAGDQDQKENSSKNNAEKSDKEIEQDLKQAQKEQRKQEEKQGNHRSTPQKDNTSEEKEHAQHLDDSLYQEVQKSAADDDRLSDKEAQLMQAMEDLERNVTKNVMKHMIRAQTAGVDEGKKW